jgi:hypothetical protein
MERVMGKRKWFLATGLLIGLSLVLLSACGPTSPVLGQTETINIEGINISNQQQGIWVTGQGKVSVVPDIASLSLGIEAQAATVAEAQSQAAEAMDRVMTALADNGVAEKDIKTQYYSIYPVRRWDDGKETLIGYRVTNTVTAKIRDIDRAGAIIDAVAEAGGDLTRINGISFSVDDPSAYQEEAREKAMADAKAKAEQLAALAGVTLGKPTYISEWGIQVPYPMAVMEAAVSAPLAATPISPGEMDISLSVQVVYAIID